MDRIIRWGILSTANIGIEHVIPAIQRASGCEVLGIASRKITGAEAAARKLGIPRAYGTYESLLDDPDIDAVYIPLPNHMHIEWMRRCLEAGKHVLCEKPLALKAQDIDEMIAWEKRSGLVAGEAFMVLHHPRWKRVKELIAQDEIGKIKHVDGFFSYYNDDPMNIRNKPEYGGGSTYDIGVYPVVTSRMVLGEEPLRVVAKGTMDPVMGIDTLSSFLLEYPSCSAAFTCSMQISPFQQMRFFGDKAILTLDTPFNTPNDRSVNLERVAGIFPEDISVREEFSACDHYTLQAEAFRKSIIEGVPFAGSLEHAKRNQRVIDAIYRSISVGDWVEV